MKTQDLMIGSLLTCLRLGYKYFMFVIGAESNRTHTVYGWIIRMDCAYSFLTNSASVSSTIFLTSLILSVCVRQIPHSLPPPKPIPMFGRLKIMSLGTHWPPLRWISLSPSGRSRERISGTVFALIPEPGRIVIPQTSWSVNVLDRRNKCSSLVKA